MREEKQEEGETKRVDEEERQNHRGASLEDRSIVRSRLHAKKGDGHQIDERTRLIEEDNAALIEQRDRMRETIRSEREEHKKFLKALELKDSKLEEAKRDLWKKTLLLTTSTQISKNYLKKALRKLTKTTTFIKKW